MATEDKRLWLRVVNKDDFEKIRQEGKRHAQDMAAIGHSFLIHSVLSPSHAGGGPQQIGRVVSIPLDHKCKNREKMVRSATEFLSYAFMIEDLDPRLPFILANAIEGKPLLEGIEQVG